ncbi:MAG: hybrid sensor histidine kinase/response regulator [Holophagales bacterium]|nr:hybrid sensor histidine kinase/response regulator [Holophagales bacterium]
MATFRVLVIDDNPYALQTIEGALAGTGYEVETAQNGLDGLAKAAANVPDAILLDLLMPGIDGLEVLRRLREDAVLSEVPVIVVTSLDERPARIDALRAGADDFIGKPVDIAELRARLGTLAKLNRFRRLAAERARLAWVAEGSRDGILLLRPDGTTTWTNESARRLLGLPSPPRDTDVPFLSRALELYEAVPPHSFDGWLDGRPGQEDAFLVRPGTRSAPPLWLRTEILDAGHATLSVRLRDVTATVESFRDGWSVAGALQHKLRTPLNGILGTLEALSGEEPDRSPEDLAEWLALVREAASRLRGHILDLADFGARLTSPDPGDGCAAGEILAAANRAAALAGVAGGVKAEGLAGTPDVLPVSSARLESVFFELFRNSVRAHPDGRPAIELRLFGSDGGVVLEVLDDGVRLPPEVLSRLWAPLYQFEVRSTGEAPGTGLGLTYVALVVSESGGTVKITNREPGPGIQVTFRFHRQQPGRGETP